MEKYQAHSDQHLIELLRSDDNSAFLEIYDRYNSLLLAYAYQKLRNKETAQDIVQEVFITLWEKRNQNNIQTHLSGYLYKSVLNKVLDIWKHNKIVRQHAETHKLTIDVDDYQTDFLIREKEIKAMIEAQIQAMPPRTRQVYELKHRQYKSTKEIAEQMGISENTVSNQLKNASAHLKRNLGTLIFIIYLLDK